MAESTLATTDLRIALNELIIAIEVEYGQSVSGWTESALNKARKVMIDTE